jgi:hypothetical protein
MLSVKTPHFEHIPRVDRPPSTLRFASLGSLPVTRGQRSNTEFTLVGANKAAFHCLRQGVS